jgi:hypothetical protein
VSVIAVTSAMLKLSANYVSHKIIFELFSLMLLMRKTFQSFFCKYFCL